MPVVISDASVLISLGAVRQLHLLRDFYLEVVVPDAVWETLQQRYCFRLGRAWYEQALRQAGETP